MDRRIINPWTWQDAIGFVQANEVRGVQRVLICAGQASVDADGSPTHPADMHAQLNQALDNLETVLKSADFQLSDVVRLNIFTTDVDAFFEAWEALVPLPGGVGLPSGQYPARCDAAGLSRVDG